MSQSLVFEKNGVEYMKLCVDITIYWTGSVFDQSEGVKHFYFTAMDVIGRQIRQYATETMGIYEPVTTDTLSLLPSWLERPDRQREILTLSLETSADPDLPSDMALDFWAVEYPEYPAGMIRLVLPTNFIEDGPTKLVELAKSLIGDMNFHSGYGGYAINWDHKSSHAVAARKEMSVLSRRYPGIELPEVPITLMAIPHGMKRVNWLTFIGALLVESSTSLDSLANELNNDDVSSERLPNGVMVIAGKEPRLGDVNRQEDLSSYYKVGKALARLRSKDRLPFIVNERRRPDEDITEEWLSYFD